MLACTRYVPDAPRMRERYLMRATELHTNQMQLIHTRLAELSDLTPEEWMSRPSATDNTVGFYAWHIATIRDWAVSAVFQGKPPIGWSKPFSDTQMGLCPIPFGMSAAEADTIAEKTTPGDVVAYSAAVTNELVRWLGSIDDAALGVPAKDGRAHLSLSQRYNDPAYRHQLEADPDDMALWPVSTLLTRACFSHCIEHLTEIGTARANLKLAKSACR